MEISFIPGWLIRYLTPDSFRQIDINILLSNILIICLFFIFKHSLIGFLNELPHFCLIEKISGVECPFCGITRAFIELTKGNLINALQLNPASIFVAMFFILQIPLRIFSLLNKNTNKKINYLSKYSGIFILLIVLTSWIIKLLLGY